MISKEHAGMPGIEPAMLACEAPAMTTRLSAPRRRKRLKLYNNGQTIETDYYSDKWSRQIITKHVNNTYWLIVNVVYILFILKQNRVAKCSGTISNHFIS